MVFSSSSSTSLGSTSLPGPLTPVFSVLVLLAVAETVPDVVNVSDLAVGLVAVSVGFGVVVKVSGIILVLGAEVDEVSMSVSPVISVEGVGRADGRKAEEGSFVLTSSSVALKVVGCDVAGLGVGTLRVVVLVVVDPDGTNWRGESDMVVDCEVVDREMPSVVASPEIAPSPSTASNVPGS